MQLSNKLTKPRDVLFIPNDFQNKIPHTLITLFVINVQGMKNKLKNKNTFSIGNTKNI